MSFLVGGAALALQPACTPVAYAPPARLLSLDSPIAPMAGSGDAQVEAGRIGEIFGPDMFDGGARFRHAVRDGLVLEAEGGIAYVDNDGGGGSREAYTGRAGVMASRALTDELQGALSVGVGGGFAAVAGGWGSFDLGAAFAGRNNWFRPVLGGDLSFDQPIGARMFTISDGTNATTLQLASDITARATLGFEAGPVGRALIVGASLVRVLASSNGVIAPASSTVPNGDGDVFISLGIGFRAAL